MPPQTQDMLRVGRTFTDCKETKPTKGLKVFVLIGLAKTTVSLVKPYLIKLYAEGRTCFKESRPTTVLHRTDLHLFVPRRLGLNVVLLGLT